LSDHSNIIDTTIVKSPRDIKNERGQSGRPHLKDDIWAFNEIHFTHRDSKDVYKEWLERPGVKARGLVNPKRHFERIKSLDFLRSNEVNDKI
jgi:hypothetical protein